jgi:hypothetical protein
MLHFGNTDTLKSVYFAYFHSIMKYGIILGGGGGNSSNSKKIFTLQKKTVRLMAGVKPRNSCRSLFNRSEGIKISFIDQLPTSHVFKRVHIMQGSKSSTVYHLVSQVFFIKRHNLK